MVIGIVDLDLIMFPSRYQVSIDVMQIASYHRKKGDKVNLCLSAKQENLSWYSKLYVIYNQEEEMYINHLFSDDRVTFLGKYFYKDVDTLPQEMKDSYPDTTIYDKLLNSNILAKNRKGRMKKLFKEYDFIRLHCSSNLNFISENSTGVFIYDYDIWFNDYEQIKALNKEIKFKHPVKVRTLSDILKWKEIGVSRYSTDGPNFIAESLLEQDLMKFADMPNSIHREVILQFGTYPDNYKNEELKKFLRFAIKAKPHYSTYTIQVVPIKTKYYMFLYECVKKWFISSAKTLEDDIFHNYFKKPEDYNIIIKVKAKDPELYNLLTSTLTKRRQDEEARKYYRRLD